jgi:hypothetical protein
VKSVVVRAGAVVAMGLLLVGTLAVPAEARRDGGWGRGFGGHKGGHHGGHHWRYGGHGHWRGHGHGHGRGWKWGGPGFVWGFGTGVLLTSPWWVYPRAYPGPVYYPAYPYPVTPWPGYPAYVPSAAPPAPAYPAPPPPPPPPAPDGGSLTPTPEPLSPPPGTSSGEGAPAPTAEAAPRCGTVTVAGHWQTRVYPDGRPMTVWVPTSTRSTCR